MLKKRYTGFDLQVLAILFEVFKQATELFRSELIIQQDDILDGFTVKISKKLYSVDSVGGLDFSGPLASFKVSVEGKISWLRRGGLKIEGTIGRPDAKSGFKPSGVWHIEVGDSCRVIDYRFVDPTRQIFTIHF